MVRQSQQMKWLGAWGIALLILAACSPPTGGDLPTLVRFPTDEPTRTQAVVAESVRTLPPTFTPTYTVTASATLDPSVTPTLTPTITVTPSATITDTPTATATEPPPIQPEDRPILAFALTAYASTVLPPDYQIPNFGGVDVTLIPQSTATLAPGVPSPIPPISNGGLPIADACSIPTTGGFAPIYQGNPDIANQLGCPTGAIQTIPAAWQRFETGSMIWLSGEILVLYAVNDSYQSVPDTFIEGSDPETSAETPPDGLFAPVRGFLKVWQGNSSVRNGLGWAQNLESGTTATVQAFSNGRMIYLPGRNEILVFIGGQSGTWLAFQGTY
ncbi:MAG: hypothetical protein ACFE0Q_02300 [Anaerolineae bacterium]